MDLEKIARETAEQIDGQPPPRPFVVACILSALERLREELVEQACKAVLETYSCLCSEYYTARNRHEPNCPSEVCQDAAEEIRRALSASQPAGEKR